jgi:hypothetical protein
MAFWSLGQDNSSAWNASEAETAPVSKSLDEKIYEPELEVVFGEILDPNEADEVSERIMRSWRSTEEDGKQTETITFEIIDEEAAADVINNEQPQTLPGNLPAGNTNSGVSPLPGNAPQSAAPLPGNTPQNASPLPGNAPQGANFYNDNNKNNLAPTQNNRNFVPETGYDPAYGSNYIPNENTSNNLNNNNFNNNNFNNSRSPSARPAPSVTSIPAPVPSANPSPAAPNGFSEAEVEAMEAFSPGNDAAPDGTFESYTPPANAETLPGGVNNGNDNGTSPQTLPGAIGNDNGNAPQTLPGTIGNDNGNGNGAQTLPGTLNTEENNLEENEDYVPSQDKNLLQPLPGIWPYQDKNSLEGPSSQDKNSLQPLPGNVPGNETLPGTPSQNEDIQTLPGTPGFQRPNPLLAPFRGLFENDSNNDGQTDPENSDRENSSPGNSGSGTSPRALPGDVTPIPTNDREYTPSDNGDDSRSFSRPIIEDDEPTEINLEAAREYIFFNNWMSEEDYFSDPYVTRSQALKAVVKMANIDESAVDQYAESYRDTKNHPDRDYIEAARARDIIAVAGDYLNPDENIKKSELIAILESAFEVPEVAASFNFSRVNDVARSESESAYSAINKFYAAGVIKVDENNNFHPNDLLTKEEFAHIIYNMKDYQAKSFDGYNFSGKVILDRIFSSSR